jgi:hypothetical protein
MRARRARRARAKSAMKFPFLLDPPSFFTPSSLSLFFAIVHPPYDSNSSLHLAQERGPHRAPL